MSIASPDAPALGDYEGTLAEALREHLAAMTGQAPPRITHLVRLTGGVSHQTWSFDALHEDSTAMPLVVRLDLAEAVLESDTAHEFGLLATLHERGVPVPRPHSYGRSEVLDAGFLVSERLDGTDLRKALAAEGADGRRVGDACVGVLAQIHQVSAAEVAGSLAGSPDDLTAYIEHWLARATVSGDRLPIIPAAVRWLRDHYQPPTRTTLVHADFKANNLLVTGGRPFVLDWELAHLGDPLEDLAWTLLWTTPHDVVGGLFTRQEFLNAYAEASGVAVDHERLAYWEIFALVKLAAIFILQGTRFAASAVSPTLHLMGRALPALEHRIASGLIALSEPGRTR